MYMLNILIEHKILFLFLIGILIINFGCIIYLVLKERKTVKEDDGIDYEEIIPKKELEEDKKLESNKLEIEEMLTKMQQNLETKPEDVVSTFEHEQEEKSIISYQELVSSVKEKKNTNPTVQPVKIEIENDIEKDIEKDIDEVDDFVLPKISKISKLKETLFDDDRTLELEPIKENTSFKTTDFISPIFGILKGNLDYPTVPKKETMDNNSGSKNFLDQINFGDKIETLPIDQVLDLRPLEKEKQKNDEFLNALKEFRKKLD